MPFEVGDKIVYDDMEGEITKVNKYLWAPDTYSIRVYNKHDKATYWDVDSVYEAKLKPLTLNKPGEKICECGAHFQKSFENFHAVWCPLYKDRS